jgi:sporulation protein YlmC with PRC-barrel domain
MRRKQLTKRIFSLLAAFSAVMLLMPGSNAAAEQQSQTGPNMMAENVLDMEIRTTSGEQVGEIEDVIFNRRGKIKDFIVDVGGFLGIGEKQVAVPFKKLKNMGPYFVMYPGTEAQLESMPAFDGSKPVGTKKEKES